jgi:hypothetical protein
MESRTICSIAGKGTDASWIVLPSCETVILIDGKVSAGGVMLAAAVVVVS